MPAVIAYAVHTRWQGCYMIRCAAVLARPPAGQPPQELIVGNVEIQNAVDALSDPGQQRIKRHRLSYGSRKSVQQEAVRTIRGFDSFLNETDNDVIWNQLPIGPELLRL